MVGLLVLVGVLGILVLAAVRIYNRIVGLSVLADNA